MPNKNYTADSIGRLSDKEAMRTRGTMYFGSYSIDAVYHIILEIVSNSIDERMMGFGTKCSIIIHKDNSIEITDNARGIPVGINKDGDDALEVSFSVIHAGGKLGKDGQDAYNSSGGLNGIGLKIATYTSKFCIGTIKRDGNIYQIAFKDGDKEFDTKVIGKTKETGTSIHFLPDVGLFGDINIDPEVIHEKLRELSFLTKGYIFELIDERSEKYSKGIQIKSDNGLLDYSAEILGDIKPLCKPIYVNERDNILNCEIEFVLQYTNSNDTNIKLFTNNIPNTSGLHYTGFSTALTSSINKYARANKLLSDKDNNFTGSDLQEGMILIMNVRIPEPQFDSQVKSVLKDTRGRTIASKVTKEKMELWLSKNKKEAKSVITKILSTQKALEAAKKAKNRLLKSNSSDRARKLLLGDKYTPCKEKDPSKCELYICEGDSAMGTIKGARDANIQAVLGLGGKILNVGKEENIDKILSEKGKIQYVFSAIGAGIGKDCDIKKSRFKKIMISTDEDVDGKHIQILLVTLLWKYMRPLIEAGYVYILRTPLYIMTKGKVEKYLYSEEEANNTDFTGYDVVRIKGLGEMGAKQLFETTIDPSGNRNLVRITIKDAELAEEKFNDLMGKAVAPRRKFIQENANLIDFKEVYNG